MRRRLRHARAADALRVDPTTFEDAAEQAGFALDTDQREAARTLAATGDNVYLCGPPGRGKSWLMATYYAAAPTDHKLRVHFHEFFRDLHLAAHRRRGDLGAAVDGLIGKRNLVCFDEFHVHDPADGIFIDRLLRELARRNVRLVTTSNYAPAALLPNPLFHDDFLPTIEFIERTMTVMTLTGPVDHRQNPTDDSRFATGQWVAPGSSQQLEDLGLRPPVLGEITARPVNGRLIRTAGTPDGRLWIGFAELCHKPTAPADYIVLSEQFSRWVIEGVPDLRRADRETRQRFANLVDVLHDRDVCVVFLADVPASAIATSSRLFMDGGRTLSRLGEVAQFGSSPAGTPSSDPTGHAPQSR